MTITATIPANIRNLNRSVSVYLRNGFGDVLSAKLTGSESVGSEIAFRTSSREEQQATATGKVTAVAMPVTGNTLVTIEASGELSL